MLSHQRSSIVKNRRWLMQNPQLQKEFSKILTNKIIRDSGGSCSHYQSRDTPPRIYYSKFTEISGDQHVKFWPLAVHWEPISSAVLCALCLFTQLCPTLCDPMEPARLLCPWGFSRQESWSGLPCSLPGDLPDPGIEPRSPTLPVDSLPSEPPGKP